MSAPPPLPAGGPPPPLPAGGPPPMPVGGLPPPNMGPPPMGGPPHRGGRNHSPFTNTILITNLPSFFVGYQQVRDWLYPCGTAKTCLFYPRPPKRKKDDNGNATKNEADEEQNSNLKKTVLVNMTFPDQAVKVVASFKTFSAKLDDRYKDIRCYMVPSSPDVPMPPALLDETAQEVLGDKLWHNFVSLETTHEETTESTAAATADKASSATTPTPSTTTTTTTIKGENSETANNTPETGDDTKLLDADKAAGAAGGTLAYDADEDPLNAPHVLEAVKEFRREIDRMHETQRAKRMELVAKKLKEMRPRIRVQVDAEKKNPRRPPGGLAPPPLPGGLPPPMPGGPPPPQNPGLPPPPVAAADSGKRGRSNLPAWMTQQQQQQDDEPASKKIKTEDESSYPSHFPSSLPASSHAMLRQFLADQVKEYMGEEEATLIDFLYKHIVEGKTTAELLQALQVLEEEADAFLKEVWAKVREIQQS